MLTRYNLSSEASLSHEWDEVSGLTERGRRNPSLIVMARIAEALGVALRRLLSNRASSAAAWARVTTHCKR
jgi:transcriptional regulator with XRE-family HTH domain